MSRRVRAVLEVSYLVETEPSDSDDDVLDTEADYWADDPGYYLSSLQDGHGTEFSLEINFTPNGA